jgi:hypothetical protein
MSISMKEGSQDDSEIVARLKADVMALVLFSRW